jgi:hypothetical protein
MQWDSADLLSRLRTEIRQPSTSTVADDTACYEWLSRGQDKLFRRLAALVPESQYQGPVLLTASAARTVSCTTVSGSATVTSATLFLNTDIGSSVSGTGITAGSVILAVNSTSSIVISKVATASATNTLTFTPDPNVFTFGADGDGNAILPIGTVEVYGSLAGIPGGALKPGVDFLIEGTRLRGLNNQPWAGPGPYVRYIVPPTKISATVAPTLQPVQMRECCIYDAATTYYRITKDADMVAASAQQFEEAYLQHLLALRVQFYQQDAQAGLGNRASWIDGAGFGVLTPLGGG